MTTDPINPDYQPNPAKLRGFYVRLRFKDGTFTTLKVDAIDAWDANALVRLNYPEAMPFAFAAWAEKHWDEMRDENRRSPACAPA